MMDETDREAHQKLPPVICYPVDTLPAPDLNLLSRFRTENVEKSAELIVPPRDARCFECRRADFSVLPVLRDPKSGT